MNSVYSFLKKLREYSVSKILDFYMNIDLLYIQNLTDKKKYCIRLQ